MKKVLVISLFVAILITGCKKEDSPTTYQIVNNTTLQSTSIQYLDGSMYEIVVYCYKGTDIVRQDNFAKVASGGGKSEKKAAEYDKVKVSFKMLPPESTYYSNSINDRLYVVAYTVLTKGSNTQIIINGQTQVSKYMKSSLLIETNSTFGDIFEEINK